MENTLTLNDIIIKNPKNRAERAINRLNAEFAHGNPYSRPNRAWAEYNRKIDRLRAISKKYS